MAIVFADLKENILLVLYDYMLTSNHETYWFSLEGIQEALPPEASGAFIHRALTSLVDEDVVELGGDGEGKALYALTEDGIETAQNALEARGIKVRTYQPSPNADRILSKINDAILHQQIEDGLREIGEEIGKSNSVADELGDEKELIANEIDVAHTLSQKDRFRLVRLAALIVPTLRYIADKFGGQALGELAKRMIQLLLGAM